MSEAEDARTELVDQFTRQAEGYTRLTSGLQNHRKDDFLGLPIAPDDIALDVACGSGSLAIPVAARVRHVTAIDLTPAMIEQGIARQAERGIDNIEWLVGDVEHLPFGDASFSLVMCSAAFHHLREPGTVFAEMVRVCRTGGRIVVRDMAFPHDKARAFDAMEIKRDPSHARVHTLEELRSLAQGHDLAELLVEPYVTPPLPFEAILATSFPKDCSRDAVHRIVLDDAISGTNALGLNASLAEGKLFVSYPMATLAWRKGGCGQLP